jgi:hypothetical protein
MLPLALNEIVTSAAVTLSLENELFSYLGTVTRAT